MVAQLGWALLASPPVLDFGTGASVARPLLGAPRNVRSYRVPRRSSSGARVLSLSYVRHQAPFVMAEDAAGAALIFAATWGNLLEILAV